MWFFGLIVVVLIGAVAVVASGRWGAMSTAYDDRPDMTVPARQVLTSTDIESARFAVGVRGYRMDEVDTLLERVAKEVAERDRRIADLERAVAPIVDAPDGAGFSSKSYDASEFEDTGPHQPILVGGDFPASKPADDEPADSAAEVPQVAVPVAPADPTPPVAEPEAESRAAAAERTDDDDEPETSELPRTRHEAAADEYERLQAEARALLEAQSQPVTPRRTPAAPHPAPPQQQPPQAGAGQQSPQEQAPHGQQPPQASSQQSLDQEPALGSSQELPLASSQQSSDQRPPQAAAPQSSEAAAPPVAAQEPSSHASAQRATDAQQAPADQPAPAEHWTQMPPQAPAEQAAPVTHWTQAEVPQQQSADGQQVSAEQAAPAQHWTQAQESQYVVREQRAAAQPQSDSQQVAQQQVSAPQQQSSPQQGDGQQGEGEGWQFWPPADQEGEGAYQRPS